MLTAKQNVYANEYKIIDFVFIDTQLLENMFLADLTTNKDTEALGNMHIKYSRLQNVYPNSIPVGKSVLWGNQHLCQ